MEPQPERTSDEILVYWILRDSQCGECGRALSKGSFLTLEQGQPLCLECSDLDHLIYLPRGDAALTRRARKYSALSAVLLRFSRSRGHYERQGLLVEEDALERAEKECLSDESARAARRERDAERRAEADVELARATERRILELYPGCPPQEALGIAQRATQRSSGRVGRSAAGRALEDDAVRLAVIAAVRHRHTGYDELLMRGHNRSDARRSVRARIDEVLARWSR